jgi:hypothetical protein
MNLKINHRIPMWFQDGDGGRQMLPQFKGKTCIDLVIEGHKPAQVEICLKHIIKLILKLVI